ncbi:MAG: AI-2E family transporter [Burkholderiales bacterium PBB3]|nr:MAG: AI-2E family transporter [Burkholderiales bacterium PBB3]
MTTADDAGAAPVQAPAAERELRKREPLLLHMPVNVRSASLLVLAVLACIFALRWAAAVCIPLMLSLLLTYALAPLIAWLERRKISRWISSAVVLLGLVGAMAWTGYSLSASAAELLDSLPVAAQKLRQALHSPNATNTSALESVQQAAAQLEQVAQESPAKSANPRGVMRVTVERPRFNVRDYLWSGTVGLLGLAGQMILVAFLTYFALGSGNTFRRKLVKISGASLAKKKITVHVLDDIRSNIERYLLVQIFVSAVVGLATGVTFWALGMDNAAVWGVFAAVTNLIPYSGSVAITGAASLLAFMQFNSLQMALVVGGASLFIHTLVGYLLLPWLTTRANRISPVVAFVALIFWGWMWGIWGLLLGVPIVMVIKSVCDKVEDLQGIGELLGD